MKNKFFFLAILFSLILIIFFTFKLFFFKDNSESPQNEEAGAIILFFGTGCPHCAKVKNYIKKNKVKEKISLIEKEVYFNQKNAVELGKKAKICGLPSNMVGVPFLWDGEKCFVGDDPIINFFEKKLKEK